MWELIKTSDPTGFSVAINYPRTLSIGRFGCDIEVIHPSISRNHATLEVTRSKDGLNFLIKDHSSLGTRINGVVLINDQKPIVVGDRITLGAHVDAEFRLQRSTLTVVVSSMDRTVKQRIKRIVNSLFGEMTNVCDTSCSLLVMPCLVVTAKVVCALLASVPIVTPAYLEEFLTATSKIPFCRPNPESFLPLLKEERVSPEDSSCFLPNEKRSYLFSKTTFYILVANQFETLTPIIRLGKGQAILCDSESTFLLHYKERFCSSTNVTTETQDALQHMLQQKGACVVHVQQLNGEARTWQNRVYSALRVVRKRPILESEIGFAVVYSSTDCYCNPQKRCPQKLYEEAGISQTTSINPFRLESQLNDRVFNEHPANLPSSPTQHPSAPKRPWCSSSDLSDNQPEAKRQCCTTSIVPPISRDPPSHHSCLVPDSEPPSFPTPVRLSISADLTITRDSPQLIKQSPLDSKNVTSQPKSANRIFHPSVEFTDPLSVLNSMPSLVASTSVLSSNTNSLTVSVPNTTQISRKKTTACSAPLSTSPIALESLSECHSTNQPLNDTTSATRHDTENCVEQDPLPISCRPGWLTKRIGDFVPGAAEQPSEVQPPVEFVNLVARKPLDRPVARERGGPENYKLFKKVWPRKRLNSHPIQLSEFLPGSDHVTEETANERDDDEVSVVDREREFVNKLFEKMCEMPRARL